MTIYSKALLLAAAVISLPSTFLIVVGIVNLRPGLLLVWSGMMILWWSAYFYVRSDRRFSFWGSFLLVNLFWWPLLVQTIRRIAFVMENDGMEGADGHGSPLAFLIGIVFEQAFFLPLSVALVAGLIVVMQSKARRATR